MDSALRQLCVMEQTYLGLVAMILIILAGIFLIVSLFLGVLKRGEKKIPLLKKAAGASLVLALILIIIYIISPAVLDWLGMESAYERCLRETKMPTSSCEDYCRNNSIDNCTCSQIMY